jgi:hypothetical protein
VLGRVRQPASAVAVQSARDGAPHQRAHRRADPRRRRRRAERETRAAGHAGRSAQVPARPSKGSFGSTSFGAALERTRDKMEEKQRGKRKTPAGRSRALAMPARRRAANAAEQRKMPRISPKKSTRAARAWDARNDPKPERREVGEPVSKRRSRSPQMRAAADRGSRKPVTKRALRSGGPKAGSGSTRGGKR